MRVMRALREAAADAPPAAAGPQAPPAAAPVPDPYTVLGVDADADTASVRKAYWRLSLLVHPDKCSHPSAHEAFQAVSKAAKLLQDAEARKAHDAAAEDAALRKAAMAAAAAAERQAAWAAARGEALPPEVAAQLAAARAAAAGPAVRETWMTDLPPEKRGVEQALANLSQVGSARCMVSTVICAVPVSEAGSNPLVGLSPPCLAGLAYSTESMARTPQGLDGKQFFSTLHYQQLSCLTVPHAA